VLSIPLAKKIDTPSVNARRAPRRSLRFHLDTVEKVVEHTLVNCDARCVVGNLGQPEIPLV
jgi:hypothetical protein